MKKTNDKIHFKKIHIKQVKKENPNQDDININNNIQQKNEINYPNVKINKICINPQINIVNNNHIKIKNKNKHNEDYEENNNFNLDDINNQLDEILENIDMDGIDEINKKIKYLGEDKKMLNTISYNDENDNSLYKKIDNKKKKYDRNKIYNHTEVFNNYNRHNNDYKNISNNRYLFTNANNNSYRYWKDENNCIDDEEDDNYLNKTNISLFYKYNKFNNYNKSNNYYE